MLFDSTTTSTGNCTVQHITHGEFGLKRKNEIPVDTTTTSQPYNTVPYKAAKAYIGSIGGQFYRQAKTRVTKGLFALEYDSRYLLTSYTTSYRHWKFPGYTL